MEQFTSIVTVKKTHWHRFGWPWKVMEMPNHSFIYFELFFKASQWKLKKSAIEDFRRRIQRPFPSQNQFCFHIASAKIFQRYTRHYQSTCFSGNSEIQQTESQGHKYSVPLFYIERLRKNADDKRAGLGIALFLRKAERRGFHSLDNFISFCVDLGFACLGSSL